MKKIISLMLSFLITSSLVIGCSNTKEDNSDKSETTQKSTEKVTVNMGAPDGLPAIAIAKLSQENPKIKDNYEVTNTISLIPIGLIRLLLNGALTYLLGD